MSETSNHGQTGTALRVLVVDDARDMTQVFSKLLTACGHNVRVASDGPAALEAARDFQPDAVLLDIGLPGMDGYEVARRLRQEKTLEHVVLIAMTGYDEDSDREDSQDAGFDHHLVKPADIRQVQAILATINPARPV